MTTQATYNGIGGVKLTDVDANGNTTSYCYNTGASCSGGTADPYWRILQTIDPYSATVIKTYPSGSSPDTANSSFTFNSGNSINSTTITTDGYGGPINSQTAQSPSGSNFDTLTTAYGWSTNYRTVATSQPCSTTSGSSCTTVHTVDIDPLGRLYTSSTTSNETLTYTYTQNDDLAVLTPAPSGENSKQLQNEYDGLGRLSKSCAIGNGSIAACGQRSGTANGVTTSYSYSAGTGWTKVTVTRGSQTRSKTFDALGRVTQKVTPEGGTWNYYYDTAACTGSLAHPGLMTCSADPNGNTTVYGYDSLSRLSDVGSGSSGTTACKRFRYDNTTGVLGSLPTGVALSNQYGRLAEAETDDCTWPVTLAHQITDEWFAYDKVGNSVTQWQLTPHSTQYYKSSATFAGNRVITKMTPNSPNIYAVNYTLDGEGRPTYTDLNGTHIAVSNVTYNAASQPTNIVVGSGTDYDAYTYDLNTGTMTGWTYQVGTGLVHHGFQRRGIGRMWE